MVDVVRAFMDGNLKRLVDPMAIDAAEADRQDLAVKSAARERAKTEQAENDKKRFGRNSWPAELRLQLRPSPQGLELVGSRDGELTRAFKAAKGKWNGAVWTIPLDQEASLGKRLMKIEANRRLGSRLTPKEQLASMPSMPGVTMSAATGQGLRFQFEPHAGLAKALKGAGALWDPGIRAWTATGDRAVALATALRRANRTYGRELRTREESRILRERAQMEQAQRDELDPRSVGHYENYPKFEGLKLRRSRDGEPIYVSAPYSKGLIEVMHSVGGVFSKTGRTWCVPANRESAFGHALAATAPQLCKELGTNARSDANEETTLER